VSVRGKNWDKAIEHANKSLAVDDDDPDMYGVLYEAYTGKGDKEKAAAAKAKMPANAAALYNDAVKLLNANKDAEAEKILRQVISVDEKFALAYFHLGMISVRAGKNADAKANFQKYLELDPSGSEAATAKEMMKYIK
jgi:predicted Zn-dependent protease